MQTGGAYIKAAVTLACHTTSSERLRTFNMPETMEPERERESMKNMTYEEAEKFYMQRVKEAEEHMKALRAQRAKLLDDEWRALAKQYWNTRRRIDNNVEALQREKEYLTDRFREEAKDILRRKMKFPCPYTKNIAKLNNMGDE